MLVVIILLSSGLLFEKPFKLGCFFFQSIWFILKWKGCHLFSADGSEEGPSLSLSAGLHVCSDHTSSFLFPCRCEWSDRVSVRTAVFLYPVSVFFDKLQELFCSFTGLTLAEHVFEGAVSHIGAYIRTRSNYKVNKPVPLNQYSPPKVTNLSVCHKLKVSIY